MQSLLSFLSLNTSAAIDNGSQLATITEEQQCKGDIGAADVTERCCSDGCNWDEELVDLDRLTERIYKLKTQLLGSRSEKLEKRQWVLVDRTTKTIRERDDPVMGFKGLASKFSVGSAVNPEASLKTSCVNLAPDVEKHFNLGNLAGPVTGIQEVEEQKDLSDYTLVKPQCLGERTRIDGGNFTKRARKDREVNTRVQLLHDGEATRVQFLGAANDEKFTQEKPVQEATTCMHLISKSTHVLKRKQVLQKSTEVGSGEEIFTGGMQMEVAGKPDCAVEKVSMRGALKTHPTYITARKDQQSRNHKLAHGRLKKVSK